MRIVLKRKLTGKRISVNQKNSKCKQEECHTAESEDRRARASLHERRCTPGRSWKEQSCFQRAKGKSCPYKIYPGAGELA